MSVTFTSQNRKASGSAPQAYIPSITVPPNQIEFDGWCWAYYEVEQQTTVRLSVTAFPEGTDVQLGWSQGDLSAHSLDLSFAPGSPTVAFWVRATLPAGSPSPAPVAFTFEEL